GWSFDHRIFVLLFCIAIAAGGLQLAAGARVDNSYEAYFDVNDPTYLAYEQYREDFGSDEISYILYDAPDSPHGAWNLEVMHKIAHLTSALEDEVPFIYDVKSVVNAELVEGVPDGIEISELKDDFPESQQALLTLRDRYLAKPMLVGGLVSDDRKHAALIIKMDRSSNDPPEEIRVDPALGDALENLYPQATAAAIEAILARPEYAGIDFYHSGDVPLNAYYNRVIANESGILSWITSALIGLVLLACFRSIVGTLAPLVVVQLCVILCVALVAAVGWKLTIGFSSLPTLVTAIGVAHSVHILSEFRGRFAALRDRRQALVDTLYLVGTPCLLTSLTTAAGFGAMSFVPIKSIAQSGAIGAFGVLAAFVMSLTLLMALLSFGRRSPRTTSKRELEASSKGGDRARAFLLAVAAFDVRHRRAILAGFAVIFLLSVLGISRLQVDSNWLDDFADSEPIKLTTVRVDEVMGGTTNVIYLFDAGVEDGIKEPAVLREMERVQSLLDEQGDAIRKTYSLVDILKDLNQAFHDGDPAWHKLPESRELVAQYLILYESSGGEDAEEYVSSDYRRASVEARIALGPTSVTANLVERVDAALAKQPLQHAEMSLTGIGALWLKLMDYIVTSQVRGFLLAFGVIALMMICIFRSFRTGMISMVPNLTPVALALGFMGYFGIPLDYSKVSIAAVAIGIAVDDTVHLMSRYRHEFQIHRNYEVALQAALQDVGRALLITSVALVLGFLVFLLSSLHSQAMYGVLLASTIVSALVADFLLMPALVLSFKPFGPEGAGEGGQSLSEAA
ncbi:MAG: MMPL family transporter, partial [Myxococcales bacterium]|nr:MMPL family transporter [Myxococcales bacterium]